MRARQDWTTGRPYQVAGWAFTSGMMYMSFFSYVEHWSNPPEAGWVPHGALVGIIGGLFALPVLGLGATLARKDSTGR